MTPPSRPRHAFFVLVHPAEDETSCRMVLTIRHLFVFSSLTASQDCFKQLMEGLAVRILQRGAVHTRQRARSLIRLSWDMLSFSALITIINLFS
jgi:hypothetical protein